MSVVPFCALPKTSIDRRKPRINVAEDYKSESHESTSIEESVDTEYNSLDFLSTMELEDFDEDESYEEEGEGRGDIDETKVDADAENEPTMPRRRRDAWTNNAPSVKGSIKGSTKSGSTGTYRSRKKPGMTTRFVKMVRENKYYIRFQQWRAEQAELRRHHIIKEYESKIPKLEQALKEEIAREIEQQRKDVLRQAYKLQKVQAAVKHRQFVKSLVNEKLEEQKRVRKRESDKMEYQAFHFQIWAVENRARHVAEEEERVRQIQEEIDRKIAEEKAIQKQNARILDKMLLQDDLELSQKILEMARKSSAIAGVNAHLHVIERVPPPDTTKRLQLYLRDDVDFSWKPRMKRNTSNPFTVDLKTYHQVEILECINIGERGCLALSAEFVRSACSHLMILDMTRCQIHTRGLGRLLHGIRLGRLSSLHTLILKGNSLTPRCIDYFRVGFQNGSLRNLRVLDLSDNELGNDGASKIAHMMIENCFFELEELLLKRNNIGDEGGIKIVKVFRAVCDVKCPNLTRICLQENLISFSTKLTLKPHPRGICL